RMGLREGALPQQRGVHRHTEQLGEFDEFGGSVRVEDTGSSLDDGGLGATERTSGDEDIARVAGGDGALDLPILERGRIDIVLTDLPRNLDHDWSGASLTQRG